MCADVLQLVKSSLGLQQANAAGHRRSFAQSGSGRPSPQSVCCGCGDIVDLACWITRAGDVSQRMMQELRQAWGVRPRGGRWQSTFPLSSKNA